MSQRVWYLYGLISRQRPDHKGPWKLERGDWVLWDGNGRSNAITSAIQKISWLCCFRFLTQVLLHGPDSLNNWLLAMEFNFQPRFFLSWSQRGLIVPIINPHHFLLGHSFLPVFWSLVHSDHTSSGSQFDWLPGPISYLYGYPVLLFFSLCWHTDQSSLGSTCFPVTYLGPSRE